MDLARLERVDRGTKGRRGTIESAVDGIQIRRVSISLVPGKSMRPPNGGFVGGQIAMRRDVRPRAYVETFGSGFGHCEGVERGSLPLTLWNPNKVV